MLRTAGASLRTRTIRYRVTTPTGIFLSAKIAWSSVSVASAVPTFASFPAFARSRPLRPRPRRRTRHYSLSSARPTSKMAARKTILIDMDNTLVNYDAEFAARWKSLRPSDPPTLITSRAHFEMEENFSFTLRPVAEKIMREPGFFVSFSPMPGALEAVRAMVADGYTVFFCTAPSPFQWEECVKEKYAWVRRHLGEEFLSKIIVTRDKTMVKGDVLVDDKPKVVGACQPEWTHVVFEQSYNKTVEGRPRIREWGEWRSVLEPLLK